ncbi:MAG: hypothetical protein QUU85_01390, partial [Candidatus Eisenbacteria bacterium]|nr:hypothetical protein [Candidatus Eisenbacteria bacterium]
MSNLVRATLRFRRTMRAGIGFVMVAGFAALVVLGVFREPMDRLGTEHLVVGALAASMLLFRLTQRLRAAEGDPELRRIE